MPELFSQEQLEAHAGSLARLHRVSVHPAKGEPLRRRLEESADALEQAFRFLSASGRDAARPVGSEDWLRDNHHLVQDQVREIRRDLPKTFYDELPKLADGPFAGYPRVYEIARELVAHSAGRFELDTLVDFTIAYQRVTPLSIGETWAVPIMLRIALIEELQRLSSGVVAARRSRQQAGRWESLLSFPQVDPAAIDRYLDAAREGGSRLPAPFVVELLQWLRDQPASAGPAWQALHRALETQKETPDELLRLEHQREAADQLAIGNVISSMRLLSSIEWPLFFDRVNPVEQILRADPSAVYANMDFPTRDRYRRSIEQLSKRARQSEQDVARRAVALARLATENLADHEREGHVGYYLISRGRFSLERELNYPPTAGEHFARFVFAHPVVGYLGAIAATITFAVAYLLVYCARHGATAGALVLAGVAALIPVSELAISLVNLFVTTVVRPRQLPKLEMRAGIPAVDRTMVVVPAIVDSVDRLESLLSDLEIRFFANRDVNLHFALLSDFADADAPDTPGDEAFLAAAERRVNELNARHGADRFFLFHRQRLWNQGEGRWMGWERKRGKLSEFNRLLRGAADTSFVTQIGDLSILPSIRYVITLDSDTQLPLGTARSLVGTLSHPLNRPRFDPVRQRVTDGFGVLQPRIAVSLVSATRTAFAKVFSGHVGLDPYTTAVSDVYQDLFHEGSYVGKGIYDVDAFEAALQGRVPENTLLSHDLFEGFYVRAGLCTDVHLVDDYPANYLAFAARQHRWARGDWQIARWLWRTVPDANGQIVPNTLPVIARWKILDTLRRSLLFPSLFLLLAAGWLVLPGSAILWTGLALLVLAFPAYIQVARSLGSAAPGIPLRQHIAAERDNIVASLRQAFLSIAMIAHETVVMSDAIVRTLVRVMVTRRHLLEWATLDGVEQAPGSVASTFRRMWPAPAMAAIMAIAIMLVAPIRLVLALPILVLWFVSPVLAHAGGRRLPYQREPLGANERQAFRTIARTTWLYFEDMVGAADNYLVPDNYQEGRRELVAHRTSPTNIGLQLLSTLAAYDFGYLSATDVLHYVERTFSTLLRLPRYRGHFYNWYDTRSMAPLAPTYISTVDSGNLAGYLIALRAGLAHIVSVKPIVDRAVLDGIRDVVAICEDALRLIPDGRVTSPIRRELRSTRALLTAIPLSPEGWRRVLPLVADRLATLSAVVNEAEEPFLDGDPADKTLRLLEDVGTWVERASATVTARATELSDLTGWMDRVPPGTLPEMETRVTPTLTDLVARCDAVLAALGTDQGVADIRASVERARGHAEELIERADRLETIADDLVDETEFGFLFNPERRLFAIGFNVSEGRPDGSYYDLLASEARLASFVAIATGKVSHEHWFKLGRPLAPIGVTSRALLSWSASMFEYLMPCLVMRTYPGTLLDETCRAVVDRQIQYGLQRKVPWGISESAYYAQDGEGNFQYRAFGVPGLGFKRGLGDDLVIAPYATALAAPFEPSEVLHNLERIKAQGAVGRYGYYDAIDYTPERVPLDRVEKGLPLPTYMAHHQGMVLLSLDNLLNGSSMQNHFHSDPRIQATELLLQERVPQLVPLKTPPAEQPEHRLTSHRVPSPTARRYLTPHTETPRAHLLSNGSYTVMMTNAGGGYSRRQNLALTRWREDTTRDNWGSFCYVRDLETGEYWSTTHQPTLKRADEYEVTFAPDRAVWRRADGDFEVRTELVVSPEDDVELRRVSITNHGHRARTVELTSYAEVVLATHDDDLAHPAFSNLFVKTIALPDRQSLICVRRLRGATDEVYLVHAMSGSGRPGAAPQYETDRARFIGRGRTLDRPAALDPGARLSNTTGPVLDPIVSLRRSIRLGPGGTARVAFATGFADSEEAAHRLVEKYHDRRAVARALALASTHGEIERRHLGFTIDDTLQFLRLASRLVYGDQRLRATDAVARNRHNQTGLWKYGVSGDLPILLARFSDEAQLPLFRDLLKAHEYLRIKGLPFDLVALNEYGPTYLQELHHGLQHLVESGPEQAWTNRAGGVFIRRADLMPAEDRVLLQAASRMVMDGTHGRLREQLSLPHQFSQTRAQPGDDDVRVAVAPVPQVQPSSPAEDLEFFNGRGGFGTNGREYVIRVHQNAGVLPQAPWANVVAQPAFGFVATELGTGTTWSGNSHDNRLTPWHNDPIVDPPGEAVFIRDDDSGLFWSPTPLPAGGGERYTVRHGHGYSTWEHARDEVSSILRVFIPERESVKIFHLTLRNTSSRPRSFTVTLYVDWVLGENRTRTALHIVSGREPATGALVARNPFREAFAERVAFVDLSGDDRTITGDRTEFVGRNGTLDRPAAMKRAGLSDRTGPLIDPCGAVQVRVHLAPGEQRTVIGMLGEAADPRGVRDIVERYRDANTATAALDAVVASWNQVLDTVSVRTPDRALDLMLNRWLLYQTLSCRIWGRSALYQSSGAFGFRDQLQDVLALLHAAPHLTRAHILRAASRQFPEGDVQHWWHEPAGQGVRTACSDDRLWLVYAALEYVRASGDAVVLDEEVPFIEGRDPQAKEYEIYERPAVSVQHVSLYEHCARAIEVSLKTGAHGLPLMGTGDWNDGMNLVGVHGQGESVWLGWFLTSILEPFAALAAGRGEQDRANRYRQHAATLTSALAGAWDGAWYRRAYFDDGTPLGSRQNEECRIDAVAQSWAVISGAAGESNARQAMASTDQHLVSRENGLVLLLTPPFDRMVPSPGYIQAYVPGIRENGGQYTHAALWTVLAFAKLGDGDRAMELLALLNPINHARTEAQLAQYRVEPYVVAADVYSRPPYTGRGGWTWYTGSAGWMYRIGVETILGLTLHNGALRIEPCIPRHWPRYDVILRRGTTEYHIAVDNPDGVNRGVRSVSLDGVERTDREIGLADDGVAHQVRVVLGASARTD